jgi:hypothetical protein
VEIRSLLLAPLLAPLTACGARAPAASAPSDIDREQLMRVAAGPAEPSNSAERASGLRTSGLVPSELGAGERGAHDAGAADPRAASERPEAPHCAETGADPGSEAASETFDEGAASLTGSADALDATTIRSVVRSHADGFMGCYQLGLGRDPNLQGRVTTRFDIDPKGKISDLTVAANDVFDCGVLECIRDHFVTIEFPPPGNAVTVLYPLVFGHE